MVEINDSQEQELTQRQQRLQDFRTAKAIALGMQVYEKHTTAQVKPAKMIPIHRGVALKNLFSDIHKDIFKQWDYQAEDVITSGRQGIGWQEEPEIRREFRENIDSIIYDAKKDNIDTAIFDSNGLVAKLPDMGQRLAKFYDKMRKTENFAYGNSLTLDLFTAIVGNLPEFKTAYPSGIDFRRLEQADAQAMHNPKSNIEDLTKAFTNALDSSRNKGINNKLNGFQAWPDQKIMIDGMPFLSYEHEKYGECLVTVNGGLVKLEQVEEGLQKQRLANKHFADYDYTHMQGYQIVDYLDVKDHKGKPLKDKHHIDGIDIKHDIAPFVCLDANILTGLTPVDQKALMDLLKKQLGDSATEFDLVDNHELKDNLINIAKKKHNPRLERSIEIAYDRINAVNEKIEHAGDKETEETETRKPSHHPKFFMTMGGAASGKGKAGKIAASQCGKGNFVFASLDEYRSYSDLQSVLIGAGHHDDDYTMIEPFARAIRTNATEKARKKHLHILYDGTATPYVAGGYADITESFAEKGYKTELIAFDAFLVKPEDRPEITSHSVEEKVVDRYEKKVRAVPWVIVNDKHIKSPFALLKSLEQPHIDKIAIFANDIEKIESKEGEERKDTTYPFAESFKISEEDIEGLKNKQSKGKLAEHFKDLIRTKDDSTIKRLAKDSPPKLEQLIENNPDFSEDNVAYQIYKVGNEVRMLAIYNNRRMIDFLQKAQLNEHAASSAALTHKKDSLKFVVQSDNPDPWQVRLQNGKKDETPGRG